MFLKTFGDYKNLEATVGSEAESFRAANAAAYTTPLQCLCYRREKPKPFSNNALIIK